MKPLRPALLLCLAAVAGMAAADVPDDRVARVEGICSARHGDVVMDGLAAFARNNGLTRDELSAAMAEVLRRRAPDASDPVRDMAAAWIGVFGSTNAIPVLKRMALDPDDPHGPSAIGSYYQIAGYSGETLAWADEFMSDPANDGTKRRSEFLAFFRGVVKFGEQPFPETAAVGKVLLRATGRLDDDPAWTDDVFCSRFPDYASSTERRVRKAAAFATTTEPELSPPKNNAGQVALADQALSGSDSTNDVPFVIPDLPVEPRVLPDEFILPEIPDKWRP